MNLLLERRMSATRSRILGQWAVNIPTTTAAHHTALLTG
jgi:hypothetical protein